MANKKAFTDLGVQRMRPLAGGRIEIGDSLTPGLVLRVTDRGVKTWSVIYKVPATAASVRRGAHSKESSAASRSESIP